jgi:hypothetical protein
MMSIEEQMQKLTGIVESLASSVVSHDDQIEKLIVVAEKQADQIAATQASIASLERQWQAYVNTLPRQ